MIIGTVVIIVFILAVLFVASWVLTRGVEDDNTIQAPASAPTSGGSQTQDTQSELTAPEATGGTTGGGTGTSNDPNITSPSPAGGVDTNQAPAGGAQ